MTDMEIKDKMQVCKIVAQAILADALIPDSEHDFLVKLMDRYELDDGQRQEVMNRNVEDDVAAMVAEISCVESKNELMVELALAVAADGEITSGEREVLARIAEFLDVTEAELDLLVKAAIA